MSDGEYPEFKDLDTWRDEQTNVDVSYPSVVVFKAGSNGEDQ